MKVSNRGLLIVLGFILTVACGNTFAQETVYKWVDENGVVHFSEEPPNLPPGVKLEVITTDPSPPPPPSRTTATTKSPPAVNSDVERQSAEPKPESSPPPKAIDVKEMSLEELDRRCEEAREAKIAPLREAEIAKCIEAGTGDQAWCDSFWADYGAPSRTASGVFIPGLFYDIRECVEAWEERNHRGLYPGDRP